MRTALLALIGSAIYATVRYNVFKGVPWSDWPTYTLNKAFALSALLLMVISVCRRRFTPGNANAQTMYIAVVLMAMHVVLSLIMLAPPYYEECYLDGRLTLAAGLSMALGAFALIFMTLNPGTRGEEQNPDNKARKLAAIAFLSGFHAALLGFGRWYPLSLWPGMMPPITLISLLLGLAAVAVAFCPRRTPA